MKVKVDMEDKPRDQESESCGIWLKPDTQVVHAFLWEALQIHMPHILLRKHHQFWTQDIFKCVKRFSLPEFSLTVPLPSERLRNVTWCWIMVRSEKLSKMFFYVSKDISINPNNMPTISGIRISWSRHLYNFEVVAFTWMLRSLKSDSELGSKSSDVHIIEFLL